jgi:putative spermidine/putrescine transport system ATP-binding protein/spermidine/putrescine transport system ATP-binding protein
MNSLDIELVSVSKSYGSLSVVKDVNLQIPAGEFVSILGPSGCGKTTTLNMIAGFAAPSQGEIRIRGRSQTKVPPERRNLGLVFQNYALFPHMTVAENVGFGLRMRGAPRDEVLPAVERALRSVHLEGYGLRYPRELSGGQQQRVALARAIAPKPSVLLLDEPLSNLDLKLREAMRIELKDIHAQLGMTFVYVTHDQEEAMAMSDRIVVMAKGAIAQEGRPGSIYRSPASRFVADFIGKSNILPVSQSTTTSSCLELAIEGCSVVLKADATATDGIVQFCSIRPEAITLLDKPDPNGAPSNQIAGTVRRIIDLGAQTELLVEIAGGHVLMLSVRAQISSQLPAFGSAVTLVVDPIDVRPLAS